LVIGLNSIVLAPVIAAMFTAVSHTVASYEVADVD
jgi:hypothetical protein